MVSAFIMAARFGSDLGKVERTFYLLQCLAICYGHQDLYVI